ncbi:aminotransferase class I/II-fold pyridoxal phosphate-dependent enzyme [Patescibacteria group bacterium]|nr:aminotransferase class I/II-fold pyridoxal phosphate-dependent enzyme [Patescibacteria group bacterium]
MNIIDLSGIYPHGRVIFSTGSFSFKSWGKAINVFNGKEGGFVYTRISNPNFESLEKKIAALEHAEAALVFSSGMAAISTVMLTFLRPGDHVVCSRCLYGGTDDLFANKLAQWDIAASFVNTSNLQNIRDAILQNTRMIFLETPTNPTLELSPIAAICGLLKKNNILVVVDNTFATPYFQRPLRLGADIAIHSATKYFNGHGDVVLGAVATNQDLINIIHDWRSILGTNPSPHDCSLVERGLDTFHLRIAKHNSNALQLAFFLQNHHKVKRIIYPALPSHPQHTLARQQMRTKRGVVGYGAIVGIELEGGAEEIEKFLNYLAQKTCVSLCVSLGSTDTMIQHPASMTHHSMPREERLEIGITDELIRTSVGIEDFSEIRAAFEAALDAI